MASETVFKIMICITKKEDPQFFLNVFFMIEKIPPFAVYLFYSFVMWTKLKVSLKNSGAGMAKFQKMFFNLPVINVLR